MKVLNPEFLFLIPIIFLFINKKNIFYIISLSFIIVALSNISKIETKQIKIPQNDVFLLIDTTYSMKCNDLKPNRLEFAKKEIKKILKNVNKDIYLFSFADDVKLIENLKSLKLKKSKTDIKMALNRVKYISNTKKIVVVISDGGEKKIKGDFIFFGTATKKGCFLKEFNATSKLNIIGKKYFKYNETDKLINYLNKTTLYKTKKITSYKSLDYYFVILSAVFFILGLIKEKIFLVLILSLIYPNSLKANQFLGCLYEYIGLKNLAIKEYKNSNSDFAKMKLAYFYFKKNKLIKSLEYLNQVKGYEKRKNLLKTIIYIKQKKYKKAFKTISNISDIPDKNIQKLYFELKKYDYKKGIIYQSKDKKSTKNNINKIKKEKLW